MGGHWKRVVHAGSTQNRKTTGKENWEIRAFVGGPSLKKEIIFDSRNAVNLDSLTQL